MTEADVSHPPGTTVYRCPLPSCEWTFTQAPPDPFAPGPVVAVVAGESLDESIARASMAILRGWYAESERAIEAHLTTHTTLEFVTEISRLNGIISDVARDLADGGRIGSSEMTGARATRANLAREECLDLLVPGRAPA